MPPGWGVPQPPIISEPTIWPVAVAMGITLLVWGLVTSLIITAVGFVLLATAIGGWISAIRHDRSQR